jgi:hypothetical protein
LYRWTEQDLEELRINGGRQDETGENQEADEPVAAEMITARHAAMAPIAVTRMTAHTTVTVLFQK